MDTVTLVGIDLGKHTFHLHGQDKSGKAVFRKKLSRKQLVEFFSTFHSWTVAMEACAGAHHTARLLATFGHHVKLISPQIGVMWPRCAEHLHHARKNRICAGAHIQRFVASQIASMRINAATPATTPHNRWLQITANVPSPLPHPDVPRSGSLSRQMHLRTLPAATAQILPMARSSTSGRPRPHPALPAPPPSSGACWHSYTTIVAPVDGVVGQRDVRVGAYVSPGTTLLAVVPLARAYVVANFREVQLTHMKPGQRVRVSVDAMPGVVLAGRVESIAPATGLTFAPIAPDNATGNFTKVVQRLPVKIVLDAGQPGADQLKVGMSVVPSVDVNARTGEVR